MIHILLLLGCAVSIYFACEWFVNAVEWLGVRMKVGRLAVGTILAAAGTALPESVVTLVAVLWGSPEHGNDIAVGAAMGGPLVVGTIAYGVTGAMLIWRKRSLRAAVRASSIAGLAMAAPASADLRIPAGSSTDLGIPAGSGTDLGVVTGSGTDLGVVTGPMRTSPPVPVPESALADSGDLAGVDTDRLARDQTWFLAIFTVKVSLGLVAFAIKPWLGLVFFAVYAVYFFKEMSGTGDQASGDDLEPLKLQPRRADPTTLAVSLQILVTLTIIFGASQLFVKQLEWAGPALGLPAVVVALLLSPIATELPEIMNAIIWVRQGKTQLALANISGAMMIQATIPSGIGILFTPWLFDAPLMIAGAVTMCSVSYLLWLLKSHRVTAWRLTAAAGFYVVFAVGLVLTL
jgi:cation:H+ antiporter